MKQTLLFFCALVLSIAALAQPNGWTNLAGYGKLANITGGKGSTPVVTATNAAELKLHATSLTPAIILVSGIIEGTYDAVGMKYFQINIGNNKTIIGQPGNQIKGIAFFVKAGFKNIILRNLNLQFNSDPAKVQTNADLLGIEGSATNIWVDHCDFSNPAYVPGGPITADGYIDIKGVVGDSITISWNHFHPHARSVQFGSSTNVDIADRKGTVHHNYFEKIASRPQLTFRGGNGHIFNNYFYNEATAPALTAVSSRQAACLKVEKNVFENSGTSVSTELASEAAGSFDVSGNSFVGSLEPVSTCTFAFPAGYEATIPTGLIEEASTVKNSVITFAGVDKLPASILNGGDQDPLSVNAGIVNATTVSPNPFNDQIVITTENTISYEIINLNGNVMESGSAEGTANVGQSLQSGMYFIKVLKGTSHKVFKVIKK